MTRGKQGRLSAKTELQRAVENPQVRSPCSPYQATVPSAKAPAERWRGCHGRDNYHDDHRRVDGFVHNRLTPNNQAEPDVREDQTDFPSRDHSQTDRKTIEVAPPRAERTRLLPDDSRNGEQRCEPEHIGPAECGQVYAHSHQDEEYRHQENTDRLKQLFQPVLAPLGEVPVVHILEDEAGGVCPDDRRESDSGGQIAESKAEDERRGEQNAASLQARGQSEQSRRDYEAETECAEQKQRGLADNYPGIAVRPCGTGVRRLT